MEYGTPQDIYHRHRRQREAYEFDKKAARAVLAFGLVSCALLGFAVKLQADDEISKARPMPATISEQLPAPTVK